MEHLWAGWRFGQPAGIGGDGQPHVDVVPGPGETLFEAIEQSDLPDEQTYVLDRRASTFAILNVFPYTSGHVMVLPKRAAATIDELSDEVYHELWALVRDATVAVKAAFRPEGLNIGVNEGTAGGGSLPEHLHVHVVPRWEADTNFMTALADVRIVSMTLADSWERLRQVWPDPPVA